jgi:2-polyprenyl-3-methyl-5-hydroxy-6-metoxy-1,4-benzoquinol methylase
MDYNRNLEDFNIKPEDYYSLSRPEMQEFIPATAKRVLDVGCGFGLFGKSIKERTGAEVWGIELDEESAKIAETNIDKVFIGDVNSIINTLPEQYFDCILFNDVLEHLADPYTVLLNIKKILSANAVVVSSIPNVRYIGNLKRLLVDKQWRYEDAGILDKTHLRFFTKKSMTDMFESLGYDVLQIEGINPVKTWKFDLLNILSAGYLSDTRFLQYASVVKVRR